jgi:hypothetical protein
MNRPFLLLRDPLEQIGAPVQKGKQGIHLLTGIRERVQSLRKVKPVFFAIRSQLGEESRLLTDLPSALVAVIYPVTKIPAAVPEGMEQTTY